MNRMKSAARGTAFSKTHTHSRLILLGFLFVAAAACTGEDPPDYPITPVGFTEVKLADGFWAPRLQTNRVSTIPFAMRQNEETGRVDNFRIAGGLMEGDYKGERYNGTDVFKVMEGAAYTLALEPDPELDSALDALIAIIAAAQ